MSENMFDIIREQNSAEETLDKIKKRIKEERAAHHYFDKGQLMASVLGPHTVPANPILNQLYKLTNAIGLTKGWPTDEYATVKMPPAKDTTRMMSEFAGFDPDYVKSQSPGIDKKMQLLVAAHELMEKDKLDDPLVRWDTASKMVGSTLGAAAGGAGLPAFIHSQNPSAFGRNLLGLPYAILAGLSLGSMAGGGLGALVSKITGGKAMDHWSSHASPEVMTAEGELVEKIDDPMIRKIFEAARLQTGERMAMQKALKKDYGYGPTENELAKMNDWKHHPKQR